MSNFYRIGDYHFYPNVNEIRHGDDVVKVRPKTAELFLTLLKADGQIVSKNELLENVWAGVVVEDHVIFQSITELRKAFKEIAVIKTHPRKGYSICEKVELVSNNSANTTTEPTRYKQIKWLGALTLFVCLISISLFFLQQTPEKQEISQGSILVLPVQNHIAENNHQWVRYGAMDLLIKYLNPKQPMTVYQVDDVLEILQRANVNSTEYSEQDINRLFEISGASLIVEQVLSGYVTDYQLVYSFHKRTETNRGAFFAQTLDSALTQLATKVHELLGQNSQQHNRSYKSDFANEMLASALDKMLTEDFRQAETMLNAVLATEPDNLTAKRLLAQSLVNMGDYEAAEQLTDEAIELAHQVGNKKELIRLLLWQAVSHTQQGNFTRSLNILAEAKRTATADNDKLYLAKFSKVSGKIYQAQKKFNLARKEFELSLEHHDAIQCSFGHAESLIDIGELDFVQNKFNDAMLNFQNSLSFSKQKGLDKIQQEAQSWIGKVQSVNKEAS